MGDILFGKVTLKQGSLWGEATFHEPMGDVTGLLLRHGTSALC